MRGDWREGDRLPPERELCERLGVGRPSLREALKALEIIGMIESRSGGTFVCNRSEFLSRPLLWAIAGSAQTDTYQLLEARIAIELELVDLAAQRATSQDLDAIANQLHVMETALQGTPFLEYGDNRGVVPPKIANLSERSVRSCRCCSIVRRAVVRIAVSGRARRLR